MTVKVDLATLATQVGLQLSFSKVVATRLEWATVVNHDALRYFFLYNLLQTSVNLTKRSKSIKNTMTPN